MTIIIAIIAALGAASAGYFGYKLAKRNTSGAIDTSDAAKLWDEGTSMRGELRTEVITLRAQLKEAIDAIKDLNTEIRRSRQETEAAREETRKSREETRILMSQIESLHVETKEMHDEVKTSNALTIGALADNQESRRILAIPETERTATEKEHLSTASDRLPDSTRARNPETDQKGAK